jgi:hypothetical protein
MVGGRQGEGPVKRTSSKSPRHPSGACTARRRHNGWAGWRLAASPLVPWRGKPPPSNPTAPPITKTSTRPTLCSAAATARQDHPLPYPQLPTPKAPKQRTNHKASYKKPTAGVKVAHHAYRWWRGVRSRQFLQEMQHDARGLAQPGAGTTWWQVSAWRQSAGVEKPPPSNPAAGDSGSPKAHALLISSHCAARPPPAAPKAQGSAPTTHKTSYEKTTSAQRRSWYMLCCWSM